MEHLNEFRKKVKEISLSNPSCVAIKGLENYMKKRKLNDYYLGLDEYAYTLGIGFMAIEVVDRNEKTLGYRPYLKYYPQNIFGYEKEMSPLILEHFQSLKDCYKYLAKELIYKIRTLGEAKLSLN